MGRGNDNNKDNGKRASAGTEEVQLLRGVARGDTRAFESLFRRYYPRLSAFFLRRTRDPHATEELIQETMMVVWERAATFDESCKPSTWILGIGYRKYWEWQRATSRAQTLFASPPDREGADSTSTDPAGEVDEGRWAEEGDPVAREVGRELLIERVRRAVERLPEEHRLVVELTFRQGMSYPEIAEVLGIPPGTVKSRMFHAKRRLKELLVQEGLKGDALWRIARG